MDNILHDSNLKITNLVESFIKKALISENNDYALTDFTDNLQEKLMELGRGVTKEIIEIVEEVIFESNSRKKKYASVDKKPRKLLTIFGEISFSRRRYYEINNVGNERFLTDCYLDILDGERMLKNVEEKLLIEATNTSYEQAGKIASFGEKISKQTVKNKINNLQFNIVPYIIPKVKRTVPRIFVQADEDHVALQDGGCAMPRIITIHEGSEGGKLINPYSISGLYENNTDTLWEEVLTYLENTYDYDRIKKVFVLGDGANWIKTSLEWLPKSRYISDKFHIFTVINVIAGDNRNIRQLLRDSIFKLDFAELQANCETIIAMEKSETKRINLISKLKYIMNNREGIKGFILSDIPGCSAEGYVSHVLSDRLSSRPLGWSKLNLDNMARLRAMQFNKEDIKILTRNKLNLSKDETQQFEANQIIKKTITKFIKKTCSNKTYSVPEINYGDREFKMKLKDLLEYKVC